MLRQIQLYGQSFELRSTDGRYWASSPKALIRARGRRKYLADLCRLSPHQKEQLLRMDFHDPEAEGEMHSMSSHLSFWGKTQRK